MEISNLRMHRKNSLRKEISPSSPITFHTPGSCLRLGYCHYPWNCLLPALRMCAGAQWCTGARPAARLLEFAAQHCLSLQAPRASCFIGLRKSSLPAPWNATATEFPTPPGPVGLASSRQGERQCWFGGLQLKIPLPTEDFCSWHLTVQASWFE